VQSSGYLHLRDLWKVWTALAIAWAIGIVLLLSIESNGTLWVNLPGAVALVVVALVARRQQRSWLAPGAFFALCWCAFVWVPLLVVGSVDVSPFAVWFIVACVVAVVVGSELGISAARSAHRRVVNDSLHRSRDWPYLEMLIALFSVVGVLVVLLLLRTKGLNLAVFFSSDLLGQAERQYSVDRYLNGVVEPIDQRLLTTAIYSAALLSGLLLAVRPVGVRWLVASLPLLPAAGMATLLTTKTSVLYSLVLIASSHLAVRVGVRKPGEKVVEMPIRGSIVVLGVALVPFFIFTQVGRYGYSVTNPDQVAEVATILRLHAAGHLAAFSAWFQNAGLATAHPSMGTYTFAGIFDALGIRSRPAGIYPEDVYLGFPGIYSNVYTLFRGLIEDFTLLGCLLALLVMGWIGGFAFWRLREGRIRYVPVFAGFLGIGLWSFVVNLFVYNTIIFAWILFALYLAICTRRETKRRVPVADALR